jgi:hypothetical protein
MTCRHRPRACSTQHRPHTHTHTHTLSLIHAQHRVAQPAQLVNVPSAAQVVTSAFRRKLPKTVHQGYVNGHSGHASARQHAVAQRSRSNTLTHATARARRLASANNRYHPYVFSDSNLSVTGSATHRTRARYRNHISTPARTPSSTPRTSNRNTPHARAHSADSTDDDDDDGRRARALARRRGRALARLGTVK